MKIITTGDWHLGNLFHGNDRLPEHRHFLAWLLSQLKQHRPDALLVAGDIFDNGNPSAAAQAAYYEFLADATHACPDLRIIITAGNHDSANRLEAPRALLTRHKVEIRGMVRRKWVQTAEGGTWEIDFDDLIIPLENAQGERIVVLAVPYLRADVVQDSNYSAGVNRILRELTDRAREKYPDTPLVMMAHMYARGADIAEKDASEKIVIGGQEEVTMEGWTGHPDYLVCGHIHKRQHIWNTDWARYPGSVLPMSFAEIDYRHGVDMVTIAEGQKPLVEFLEYELQHRLKMLPENDETTSVAKLIKLIDKELTDRPEDGNLGDDFEYLMLRITMDKIKNEDIEKIEETVRKKNAVICKIQKIIPDLDLSSIKGDLRFESVDDILNRDPLDTLKETFAIKHNSEMSENQENMLKKLLDSINLEY